MSVLTITGDNFQTEVIDSGAPVLLDFYADWCGPCKTIAPMLDELATKYADKGVKIGKINIDNDQELAARFNIASIPTLLFFKEGQKVDQLIGAQGQAVIEGKLEGLV